MVARVLVLLAALVVAAIGAGLVLLYASQARDNAAQDLGLVPVYVASQAIPAGTPIQDMVTNQQIVTQQLPLNTLRPGAIGVVTPEQLAQFLLVPLGPSQQLTSGDIGAATASLEDELGLVATQKNAVTITLDDELRLGPFLDPGDNVALFVTYTPVGREDSCTQLLVPSIRVLAVGGVAVPTEPAQPADPAVAAAPPAVSPLVTLEVTRDTPLAARIRQATTLGGISAVLLDGTESFRAPDVCVGIDELFEQDPPTTAPAESAG